MIRYNWTALNKHTKGDIKKILKYLTTVYVKKDKIQEYLLNNEYARKINKDSQGLGLSYLINLEGFLDNYMNATYDEMYVYLALASKRDLFTYYNTKKKVNYLPIWKVVGHYDINKLVTNRLLYINENNIYFVYEGEENG